MNKKVNQQREVEAMPNQVGRSVSSMSDQRYPVPQTSPEGVHMKPVVCNDIGKMVM